MTGGVIGILLGVGASGSVGRLLRWATVISPASIAIAVGVAAACRHLLRLLSGAAGLATRSDRCAAGTNRCTTPLVFRIALRALGRHKLRTFLTMLGMIIGVGAVMTMVALGNGAQAVGRRRHEIGRDEPRLHQRRQLHARRRRVESRRGAWCGEDADAG